MTDDMDDESLIGYAELHCRTERALFHRNHARRLLELAGFDAPEIVPEFVALHEEALAPVLEAARARLARKKRVRECSHLKLVP